MVPPIGVKNIGVRAATPGAPNFCHVLTTLLLLLENFFGVIFKLKSDLNQSPKELTNTTEVIIPPTDTAIISSKLKSAAEPNTGPAINLNWLANQMLKNLIK